jgi:hypothetical protein
MKLNLYIDLFFSLIKLSSFYSKNFYNIYKNFFWLTLSEGEFFLARFK